VTTNRSIRTKVITLYVAILTVVFVCFGIYVYAGFKTYLIRSLRQTLTWRAEQIASTFLPEIPVKGESAVGNEIQNRYAQELNQRIIRISDMKGRQVFGSKNSDGLDQYLPKPAPNGELMKSPQAFQVILPDGEKVEVVAVLQQLGDGTTYLVEVGAPETDISSALDGLAFTLILGFPFLIGLAIGGGYILLGRTLKPVDQIVSAAEAITSDNLAQRLPVSKTGDEFEHLSSALNRMIQRLDESFQLTAQFAADASHELRTPLTVMRGELETLVKEPSLNEEIAERIGNVLEEAERLTQIIEGLLLVSRLETGEALMEKTKIDLGDMIGAVADQMAPLAEDKLLRLKLDITPGVFVEGDEIRLKQVGVNLLDNAFKYTPEGGQVSIAVRAESDLAVINVIDSGMGISKQALPHIFDRFYRAEQARTNRTRGTGLGLSIVQSIIEAHGGHVTAESREGFGASFRIELPLIRVRIKAPMEKDGVAV
jgi:heavy metal sensor kinase